MTDGLWEKLIEYEELINRDYTNFFENAVDYFSKVFDYNMLTLLHYEKNQAQETFVEQIYAPDNYELNNRTDALYKNYLFLYDPFNIDKLAYKRHSNKFKNVICIEDLMTREEFWNNPYGKYIRSVNIHDQVCICLSPVLRFPQYMLTVYKSMDEPVFDAQEIELLHHVGRVLTKSIERYHDFVEHHNIHQVFGSILSEFYSAGIIILNHDGGVIYYNNLFMELATKATGCMRINRIVASLLSHLDEDASVGEIEIPVQITLKDDKVTIFDRRILQYESVQKYRMIKIEKTASNQALMEYLPHVSQHYRLTKRELAIVGLLIENYNNKQIADELFISISTVKTHLSNIFNKLEVSSRSEALAKLMGTNMK